MADGGSQTGSSNTDANEKLRQLPPVHAIVEQLMQHDGIQSVPQQVVTDAARRIVEQYRSAVLSGEPGGIEIPSLEQLVEEATRIIDAAERFPLQPVINATGIVIHTGLGRAPLAENAAQAVVDAARHYVPVELNMTTGERGQRSDLVRELLQHLTGAESAVVVNNNTAALVLVLSALAQDRNVIVSRGELIEIGGSFRLPDIIQAGGAILREVGTTNKTKLADFEQAIDDHAAAIIKIHSSNYRIEGFTESASIVSLVQLGQKCGLPVIHDIGSGLLKPALDHAMLLDEPDATSSIAAGVDLVLFSGDKLLGGPQAGIIVGKRQYIECIEKHPLMRAMRVDKLTLAALIATLRLHRNERASAEIPVLQFAYQSVDQLKQRAQSIADRLSGVEGIKKVCCEPTSAYLGGGSVPTQEIHSVAVVIQTRSKTVDELAEILRQSDPPIIARIRQDSLWLDLRTVFPTQDNFMPDAIIRACSSSQS